MSRIAIAQVNFKVGDISGNTGLIITHALNAHDAFDCDVIVFPELAICGYPPEDLLLRPGFHKSIEEALKQISGAVPGIKIITGAPLRSDGKLFNACLLLDSNGACITYHKQLLPNYGVFDEKRYFTAGNSACVFDLGGMPTALSICEDIWDDAVCRQAAKAGARLMININASPFHVDKISLRKQILRKRVEESSLPIIYVNMVGGQDELVFDGGSMAIDRQGHIAFQAPQFEEGLYIVEFSNGIFSVSGSDTQTSLSREESVYRALVLGVRDYVRKNGFKGALIGLSGGIDSALTLCIAVDALGKDNVAAVLMPSRYTSAMSIEDARMIARTLEVPLQTLSIEPPFTAFTGVLQPVFAGLPLDTTEENIQARCRGVLLMAISNKTGKLVLTTGNKSEMAVGYATLYGDMAGGFAPLKDISKTLVYQLCRWRNQPSPVIPQRIIDRPPTAELRENQLDQDMLPPYEILDPILERYIEQDQSPDQIIAAGFDRDTVKRVVSLVDRNEYKRRQAAPGVRITQRAFGRDRRYPITSGYRE